MESTYTIFLATLKEKKEHSELFKLISELTFELSRKKIQRLKDENKKEKTQDYKAQTR